MPTCTTPGCDAPATLQWQRAATAAETGDEAALHTETRRAAIENERARLTGHIAELQHMAKLVRESDQDPMAIQHALERYEKQIADVQAQRDALVDPEPAELGDTVIAVFGCDSHAPDVEAAAKLHPATCSSTGPCGCAP